MVSVAGGVEVVPKPTSFGEINKKVIQPTVKVVQITTTIASKAASVGRAITGFTKLFKSVPKQLTTTLKGAKVLSGVKILSSIPILCSKIKKVFTGATEAKRTMAVYKASCAAAEIVDDIGGFMNGLLAVGAIAEKAVAWVDKAAPYLFPFQVLSTAIGVKSYWSGVLFKRSLEASMQGKSQEDSIASLCKFLEGQKDSVIGKYSSFNGKILREKAAVIMERLKSDNAEIKRKALEEGAVLKSHLQSRIRKSFALSTISTVLSIISLVGSIIFIVAGAANPIGLAIVAVTATIGVGITLYKFFAFNSDPYGKPPLYLRIPAGCKKVVKKISAVVTRTMVSATERLQQLFRRQPQPMAA